MCRSTALDVLIDSTRRVLIDTRSVFMRAQDMGLSIRRQTARAEILLLHSNSRNELNKLITSIDLSFESLD